jgi:hypothetical protein
MLNFSRSQRIGHHEIAVLIEEIALILPQSHQLHCRPPLWRVDPAPVICLYLSAVDLLQT